MREVARRAAGSGVGTRLHDPRVKGTGAAAERVQRQRSRDIRGIHEHIGFTQRQAEQRQHSLRAIEQRQALFCFQRHRRYACTPQSFTSGNSRTLINRQSFADHYVREMRKRRQVAGSAHRALAGNYWVHVRVEHGTQRLDHHRPNPAQPFCQRVRTQQYHGACLRLA